MSADLFPSTFLQKLEYLHLLANRLFSLKLRVKRRRRRIGRGLEFADRREYAPGDDFRYIDWNYYGRMGQLLVKLFEEAEELNIAILMDCSGSMEIGSVRKFDYGRRVAAALAYLALANGDIVQVCGFADRLNGRLAPGKGKERIFKIMDFLRQMESGSVTSLARSLMEFAHRSVRRGLVVIVSDMQVADYEKGLKNLFHSGFDLFVIHLFSPEDRKPRYLRDVRLRDVETAECYPISISRAVSRAYTEEFDSFADEVESFCRTVQAGYVRISTTAPFEKLVLSVLRTGEFVG